MNIFNILNIKNDKNLIIELQYNNEFYELLKTERKLFESSIIKNRNKFNTILLNIRETLLNHELIFDKNFSNYIEEKKYKYNELQSFINEYFNHVASNTKVLNKLCDIDTFKLVQEINKHIAKSQSNINNEIFDLDLIKEKVINFENIYIKCYRKNDLILKKLVNEQRMSINFDPLNKKVHIYNNQELFDRYFEILSLHLLDWWKCYKNDAESKLLDIKNSNIFDENIKQSDTLTVSEFLMNYSIYSESIKNIQYIVQTIEHLSPESVKFFYFMEKDFKECLKDINTHYKQIFSYNNSNLENFKEKVLNKINNLSLLKFFSLTSSDVFMDIINDVDESDLSVSNKSIVPFELLLIIKETYALNIKTQINEAFAEKNEMQIIKDEIFFKQYGLNSFSICFIEMSEKDTAYIENIRKRIELKYSTNFYKSKKIKYDIKNEYYLSSVSDNEQLAINFKLHIFRFTDISVLNIFGILLKQVHLKKKMPKLGN
jgi:hypothetical protein